MPSAKEKLLALQKEERPKFWKNLYGETMRAVHDINLGVSDILGLPRAAQDLITYGAEKLIGAEVEPLFLIPSQQDIQNYMSETGMIPKEDMPDEFVDRVYRNIGASLLPAGALSKGKKIYDVSKMVVPELVASTTAAGGGKIAESTEWGQENPQLARALGELAGGLGGGFGTAAVQQTTKTATGYIGRGGILGDQIRKIKDTYKGAGARKRAVRRIQETTTESGRALEKIKETTPDSDILSPVQKSRDRKLASLARSAANEDAALSEQMEVQRAVATEKLKRRIPVGDVTDTRDFLENKFNKLVQEADELMQKSISSEDAAEISMRAKGKIEEALSVARDAEKKVWGQLPTNSKVTPSSLMNSYVDELANITRGGDIDEIIPFVREKLGKFNKKGKLVGGNLISPKYQTPTAKELHQFYSVLGRKMDELSRQGGQQNKIRILKKLRSSILDDLDNSGVEEYRKAISFSRDLNNKFTDGDIGKILGYARGETPADSVALTSLLGRGGQGAKENVLQLLEGTPGAKDDIVDFIKSRFAQIAKNSDNNKINTKTGKKFLQQNNELLDVFPELRTNMKNAIKAQSSVDEFMGVSKVSELSPLMQERTAASYFLKADPGDELSTIVRIKDARKTKYLKQLVNMAQEDETGKAIKGLKNALGHELLKYSQMSTKLGEVIETSFISGTKFLKRLDELAPSLIESKLLTKKEISRLRKLGKAFEGIEIELKARPAGEVISDRPSKILTRAAQIFGARIGGKYSQGSMGGSLQTANIFSQEAKNAMEFLTNDDARNLLVRSIQDEELLKDLLSDASKLTSQEQLKLTARLISKANQLKTNFTAAARETALKTPASALTPATITAAEGREQKISPAKQKLINLLQN